MTRPMSASLDDVLTMMLDEYDAPSPAAVADYARRFPALRADLLRFAAAWAVGDALPAPAPLPADAEALLEARAESFLQNALHARAEATRPVPLAVCASGEAEDARPRATSLAQLARSAGQRLQDVAAATGIPLPIMSELNGRGFRPASIRAGAVRLIAAHLGVGSDRVRQSWAGGATITPAMAFLAKTKPVALPQRDFAEAIEALDLPADLKKALLEED